MITTMRFYRQVLTKTKLVSRVVPRPVLKFSSLFPLKTVIKEVSDLKFILKDLMEVLASLR